jgi:thiol-disulfide isomerase/thioredoxin
MVRRIGGSATGTGMAFYVLVLCAVVLLSATSTSFTSVAAAATATTKDGATATATASAKTSTVASSGKVIELTAKTFDTQVSSAGSNTDNVVDAWLIEFYAPWCSHCQRLEPTYQAVAKTLGEYSHKARSPHADQSKSDNTPHRVVKVAKIDGNAQRALASRFNIRGYPSIFLIETSTPSKQVREYHGTRTLDSFVDFALKDYKQTVPLGYWSMSSPFGPVGQTKSLVMNLGVWMIESYYNLEKSGYNKVMIGGMFLCGIIVTSFLMVLCIAFCLIPSGGGEKDKFD